MTNPEEAVVVTAAIPISEGLRDLCERIYRHGLSDGWRCSQRGKKSAPVAFDEEWHFYFKNGAMAKSIEAIGNRLTAAPPVPQWRTIESAPKDGTWILVWLGGISDCADTVQWAYGGWWNGSTGHVRSEAMPTHWMPLPAAPSADAAEVG